MNYHNILHDDMRNGDGLRVVLFLSGCSHRCFNCQNPQTWSSESGLLFDSAAKQEIMDELAHNYISGITFSGGDPLHTSNVTEVYDLCKEIKSDFPEKTIWIYTGYRIEEIFPTISDTEFSISKVIRQNVVKLADVLVDGQYEESLADINYKWAGSTNQRVIDIRKTIESKEIKRWHD